MSEYQFVGAFETPIELFDNVNGQYIEQKLRVGSFIHLDEIRERGGKSNISAKKFSDEKGIIAFNHRLRIYGVWFDNYKDRHELTESQKRKLKEEMEAARRQAEAEERAKHEKAAYYATLFYRAAVPCASHPYLNRKHVKSVGTLRQIDHSKAYDILKAYYLEVRGFTPVGFQSRAGGFLYKDFPLLLVPMRGDVSRIQAVQFIDCNGHKSFLYGCKKSGAYWQSEKLPEFDPDTTMTIGIGEGVATVLSVKQVKGFPVVAAMDCGNLKPVALEIKSRFPKAKILILSDVGNGEKEALEAAQAVNGQLAIPKFTDALRADFKRLAGKDNPTDFNDYYLAKGEI